MKLKTFQLKALNLWKNFRSFNFENLLLPPLCYTPDCTGKRWGKTPLCLSCTRQIRTLQYQPKQNGEEKVRLNFHREGSLFEKNKWVMPLIYGLKYRSHQRNGRYLGLWLTHWNDLQNLKSYDCIVPVPLHSTKKRERGFNQAEIIAKQIGAIIKKPVKSNILFRKKNTGTQTKLGRRARWDNMMSCFTVAKKKKIKHEKILLVDDVYTTGATLEGCALTLKNAGIQNVGAFTLVSAELFQQKDDFQKELEWVSGYLA